MSWFSLVAGFLTGGASGLGAAKEARQQKDIRYKEALFRFKEGLHAEERLRFVLDSAKRQRTRDEGTRVAAFAANGIVATGSAQGVLADAAVEAERAIQGIEMEGRAIIARNFAEAEILRDQANSIDPSAIMMASVLGGLAGGMQGSGSLFPSRKPKSSNPTTAPGSEGTKGGSPGGKK
jgi:hypothetical protein